MNNDPVPRDARSHDPLRRPCRGRSRLLRLSARRAHRHRRAERRRQDDLFQPDVRPARRLRRRGPDRGQGRHALERAAAHAARPRARVPAHQPLSRASASARTCGSRPRRGPAFTTTCDGRGARAPISSRAPTPCSIRSASSGRRDALASALAARRSAQARSRDDDGARAHDLHVRRADGGHERRRGSGRPRPHRAAQDRQDEDHPPGRAQDGRRALARRPHHRARPTAGLRPTASPRR